MSRADAVGPTEGATAAPGQRRRHVLPDDPAGRRPSPRPHALDLVGLVVLAVAVRVPAFLAERALTFDDGVFGNSVVAMRQGGVPFRDVFSSQGPWFLPLAWLGDLLAGQPLNGPRVAAVVAGAVAVSATYLAALRLTDRAGAVLAGGILAVSGGLAWVTGPLAADGPALAFAALSFLAALTLRDSPRLTTAALLGAAVGATMSTKSLEAPVLVPVGLVLAAPVIAGLRRRRVDTAALTRALVAVAASVAVFASVSLWFGLADVWDQSVVYRTDAAANRDIPATTAKLFSTLWDRDLATLVVLAVSLASAALAWRRTGHGRHVRVDEDRSWAWHRRPGPDDTWSPSGRLLTVAWLVSTVLWLSLVVSPLFRPHVAAVSVPAALVVATYRPPLRTMAVAAALSVPLAVVQLDGLLAPAPYTGAEARIVEHLSALPEDAWVLSDEPGVVWRSGRRTSGDLVDPSMLRRQQDRYDEDSLVEAARDPRVCAFVIVSDQRFGHFEDLPARLEGLGYRAVPDVGDGTVLLLRQDCAASAGA